MKRKSVQKMIMLALVFSFAMTMAVTAAEAWYNVTLVRLGMSNGVVRIQVTEKSNTFVNQWVTLDPAMSTKEMDRMMAVLLTALSTGATIDIRIDTAAPGEPKCSKLFYNS